MDYTQLLAYLDTHWTKTTLGRPTRHYPFDRMRELLAGFGSPERQGEFVGITGSKGKGSIARLTADILQAHGLRVGLFISPHLVRVEERVQLDGRPMAPDEFAGRFGQALELQRRAGMEDLGITPLILALALDSFRERRADAAVLEVRVGGRYDPTNVVPARTVCIGPIGLEHVPGLGYSLADIAWQKVGLVKPGADCFSARQPAEAESMLLQECQTIGAPLYRLGRELDYRVRSRSERGQRIDLHTPGGAYRDLSLALLGEHQAANAALAAAAAAAMLRRRGRGLEQAALAAALAGVRWPGRLERLSDAPPVLYDGAHTPESAAALAQALAEHFPGRHWTFIVGILTGKQAGAIFEALVPLADRILTVPVPGFIHQSPQALADLVRSLGVESAARPSLAVAMEDARNRSGSVCVAGTLYLYAATREALGLTTDSP